MDATSNVLTMEELSKVDASASFIVSVNNSLVCYGLEAFGAEEYNLQSITFKLADMYTDIIAARHLVMKAAWEKDQGKNYEMSSAMAKLFASKIAMEQTVEAVQIHGGNGFVKEYHVERLMRDVKITQIYEVTGEIQKIVISSNVLKD